MKKFVIEFKNGSVRHKVKPQIRLSALSPAKQLSLAVTLSMLATAFVVSPAWASTVNCTTSGSFDITDNAVSNGATCTGAAVIPDTVTSIGGDAFYGATGLTSVTIPNSVTSIGNSALSGTGITSITIPNSVTSIGGDAFAFNTALTSITFEAESQLTSIESALFNGSSALTSVNIPSGVTSIGNEAFAFTSALTSITIPDTVTSVGEFAFADASALTSITIPASVTSIGDSAFQNATSLTSITFQGDQPTVGTDAFASIGSSPQAYVGAAATGFELDGGNKWNGLEIIRAAPPAPAPYTGPLINGVSKRQVWAGETVSISGQRLSGVSKVTVDGQQLEISKLSSTGFDVLIPNGLSAGSKDLLIESSLGNLTYLNAFEVIAVATEIADESKQAHSWTKKLDDATAKIYSKNIIAVGKVQFMFNGEEIAWVRATDASDPKLRIVDDANYLVRTVDLVAGMKNILEVYIDGERVRRTAYSR